jgi:octaprenyl-diphosphate synthase
VGKPRLKDLRERKVTLPFIKALENANHTSKLHFKYLMWKRKKSKKDIESIVHFVRENGGIAYTRSIMHQYAERAREQLETLPPSPSRDEFVRLIHFIVNRKK